MKIFSNLLFMSGAITQAEILSTETTLNVATVESEACETLKAELNTVAIVETQDDTQSA